MAPVRLWSRGVALIVMALPAFALSPIVAAKDKEPPLPDRAARLRLFDDLVDKIRKYHAPAPAAFANLGRPWADELPGLKAELERADTLPKLKVALRHLGNSLHDAHCRYQPAEPPQRQAAGFSLAVEWGDPPLFWVSAIDDPTRTGPMVVGDALVAADGIAAETLPARFALESNANQRFTVAEDIARRLTRRDDFELEAAGRKTSHWTFRRRAGGQTYTVTTTWKPGSGDEEDREFRPPVKYEDVTCARLPERKYGPYRLVERGWGVCIYLSDQAPYRNVPIVRQYTFGYSFASGPFDPIYLLELDHHLLSRTLASRPKPDGLILDLRDNGGGNNPNWFMDWWAPAGYLDDRVHYRVHPDLLSADGKVKFIGHPDILAEYKKLAPLVARDPSQERYTRGWPFFCPARSCTWDNRYVPRSRLTTAPIALLVGPRCRSSCDAISRHFSENRFGLLIGEPTASMHTTRRHGVPVVIGETNLGNLEVAVTYEVSGKTGQRIEAVPVPLDRHVPRTRENHERYDALLVDTAIGLLRSK